MPNNNAHISLQDRLNKLRDSFDKISNVEKAEGMSAYMKNKFDFCGIPKPTRELIVKPWLREVKEMKPVDQAKVANWLWKQKEREFQYVAMQVLFRHKKEFTKDSLEILEKLIVTKSWWDTVDFIAATLVGYYFEIFPENKKSKVREWSRSKNIWLNRTAILFQLKYASKTDLDLLYSSILPHLESKEFFLQKAIGWALRQYAYTDPRTVRKFVDSHELSPLSKREALKHF
ncbi:MAG: DNA alkylation repair protein [Bacteroidia bacterium]|nr:DNA alkylation repair protein [Bacteroidia bacterium]